MIPEHQVAEVRSRADIVEIVGQHVALKRAGKEFRALCPFHQEKTPSFYVVPAKGIFKCFGCGEAGDAFAFLMKRQGLSFQEAVRQVAERVGVEIRESHVRGPEEAHARLYEALAFATEFYRRQLWREPAGALARDYLDQRGIGREAAERFGLGHAPDEWQALRSAAHAHGFEDAILLEAGLVKENERAAEPYDRLRGRLVFPIADASGRVIGFGGRVLGAAREGSPKYLNSPETPVYHKRQILYGLSWSKSAIRREQAALVVEGYMDYVSLAAAGVENVVAPLGTALTEEQAQLLTRYTRRVLLLYDSDAAGLRATFRSADALLRAGVHPLVATVPAGEDPDSLVRAEGAAGVKRVLEAAVDVLDRKLEILERRGYLRDIDGRRRALDHLLPTLRAVRDPALRDLYIARVAERTGVLRETLERGRGGSASAAWGGGRGYPAAAAREGRATPVRREPSERLLLLLLLRDHERVPAAAAALGADELWDPVYRELFVAVTAAPGTAVAPPAAEAEEPAGPRQRWPAWLDPARIEALSSPARAALEALSRDPEEISDGDRVLADVLGEIRARALFRRLDEMDERMRVAQGEEQGVLLQQRAELQRAIRQIGAERGRLGFKISRRYRRRRGGVEETNAPSTEQA